MFTLHANHNRNQNSIQGDRSMKLAFYIVTAALGGYISMEGRNISYNAIQEGESLEVFQYGQTFFIVAGIISIVLTAAALLEIVKKVGR